MYTVYSCHIYPSILIYPSSIHLYPSALLHSVVAAGARVRQATMGTAIVRADRREAPAVVVAVVLAQDVNGPDVTGPIRARQVVLVALELGWQVLGEEGHVGDARRVDLQVEVPEGGGAVGELDLDARATGRGRDGGRADTRENAREARRSHLGAGAGGHQLVRRVLLVEELRLQVAVVRVRARVRSGLGLGCRGPRLEGGAPGHREGGQDHVVVRVPG